MISLNRPYKGDAPDMLLITKSGKLVLFEINTQPVTIKFIEQVKNYAASFSNIKINELIDKTCPHGLDEQEKYRKWIDERLAEDEITELDNTPKIVFLATEFKPKFIEAIPAIKKLGIDFSHRIISSQPHDENEIGLVLSSIFEIIDVKKPTIKKVDYVAIGNKEFYEITKNIYADLLKKQKT